MGKIIIATNGQSLSFSNMPELYSGNAGNDEVEFLFDSSWDGLNKTAVFVKNGQNQNKISVDVNKNNTVAIPEEITNSPCTVSIGVIGSNEDKSTVISSQYISYGIEEGVALTGISVSENDIDMSGASTIVLHTDDQNLLFDNMPEVFSGDVNYDKVKFVFDDSWELFSKTAVFYTDDENAYSCFLDPGKDYTVKIPSILMAEKCDLKIGAYGISADGKIVKTTQVVKYKIGEGCNVISKETSEVPTEYWQQVLASVEAFRYDHESRLVKLRDDVDALRSDVDNLIANLVPATTDETKSFLGIE